MEKTLYKLMKNISYGTATENVINRIDVKHVSDKGLFKMAVQTKLYVTKNI